MATFEVDDPGLIDAEVETTVRYTEGGRLPEGIPAVGFLMLVDRRREGRRGPAVRDSRRPAGGRRDDERDGAG
jgi:hypothetical protein